MSRTGMLVLRLRPESSCGETGAARTGGTARRRRNAACAAALLALACGAGLAQAQDLGNEVGGRDITFGAAEGLRTWDNIKMYGAERVEDRDRRAYKPDGLRIGNFLVFPTAGVSAQYDDNIYGAPRNAVSDIITQYEAGARILTNLPRHSFDFAFGGRFTHYAELIQHGGLYAWNDREIAIAAAMGENSEPEQALLRLAGRAPKLAKLVADAIDDGRSSVRGAYEHLRVMHETEPLYLEVLETEAAKLSHLMPVLLLSPGGPYQQILERVIYDLEPDASENRLVPSDKVIFARAKQQVEALKSLADSRPDRYARVARIIDEYNELVPQAQAQRKPDSDEKRRLN